MADEPCPVYASTPTAMQMRSELEITTATSLGTAFGPVVATRISGETSAYAPIARSA